MATKITLLEIDAPNAQFNAPFSGRSRPSPASHAGDGEESESGVVEAGSAASPGGRLAPLLVLLLLVAAAAILRFLREEPGPETAES